MTRTLINVPVPTVKVGDSHKPPTSSKAQLTRTLAELRAGDVVTELVKAPSTEAASGKSRMTAAITAAYDEMNAREH